MSWHGWIQMLLMFFGGAWIYSRGARHESPLPGQNLSRQLGDVIQDRRAEKDKTNKPQLPRVGT